MSFNVLASQSIFSKSLKIVLLILINCKPLITSAPLIEMKYIFIFILFSSLSMAAAQILQRSAITAAGASYADTNFYVSSSIGETFTRTLSTSNLMATQGFQQATKINVTIHVNLKLFLQGYYDGSSTMKNVLYNQGEVADPSAMLTDYLTVELHEATSPYAVLVTTIDTLKTDGTIRCRFPSSVNNTLCYIGIRHRNTIETWSALPVMITADMNYDFTNDAFKAYGGNQFDMSGDGTVWAFYTGDVNQDQNTDLIDLSLLEEDVNNYLYGYYATDLNGDGNADLLDISNLEDNINNYIYAQLPY